MVRRYATSASNVRTPADDARDALATTILAHVPVEEYDFKFKAVYLGLMVVHIFSLIRMCILCYFFP